MTEPVDQLHQPQPHAEWPLMKRIREEWGTLLKLGAPILIGQLAQMSNGVIDTVMAGRASADDLSGVAIGNSLWVPIFLFLMGILNATQPIISGHNGAAEHKKILPVTWNAFYIAITSAVLAMLILFNIDPIFGLIGLDNNPARISNGYLESFALGIPALLMLVSLRGLTDGLGHTRIFMLFSILTACINAPLNYILIFGKLGMPALGGIGCGWATAIAQWITLIAALTYLHFSPDFKSFHLWHNRSWPQWRSIQEILQLGVPIGFTIFVEATMFSAIALLLASLGAATVAGHQIALNVVSVLFMVPLSIGSALTLRISFLIGAKNPESARLVARSTIVLVLAIAFSYATLLFVFAEPIARIYTTELAVIAVASTLLGYGAMFQIADVLQVVCISALRGYKDTKISMYIMLSSFWGIGVPLGYSLAMKDWLVEPLGAPGFWIGMIAGLSHAAFWLVIRLFWYSGKQIPA
ncbi:MAG: MATE family efflux transporter [Reinekea sp.]